MGKGDGPDAGIINTRSRSRPPYAKNQNGGVFQPGNIEAIDGQGIAHGSRDMPIWGQEYSVKAVGYYIDYPRDTIPPASLRGRILALVSYIYGLQEK